MIIPAWRSISDWDVLYKHQSTLYPNRKYKIYAPFPLTSRKNSAIELVLHNNKWYRSLMWRKQYQCLCQNGSINCCRETLILCMESWIKWYPFNKIVLSRWWNDPAFTLSTHNSHGFSYYSTSSPVAIYRVLSTIYYICIALHGILNKIISL